MQHGPGPPPSQQQPTASRQRIERIERRSHTIAYLINLLIAVLAFLLLFVSLLNIYIYIYECRQDVDARRAKRACCETITMRAATTKGAHIRVSSSSRSRARHDGRRVVRWKITFKESGQRNNGTRRHAVATKKQTYVRPLAECNGRTNI